MTLADVAWPVDAGKRLRAASMVSAVAARCDVDVAVLFADADPSVRPLPTGVAANWQVIPPRTRPPGQAGLELIRSFLPWQVVVQDWTEPRRAAAAGDYDLVWFGALDHFARLRSTVRARHVIVDCDDVETEKLRRFLSLPRSSASPLLDRVQRRIELPMWGRIQRQAVRGADAVLVCSELDRARLAAQAAPNDEAALSRIVSVPNTYQDPSDGLPSQPVGPCTLVVIANYGTDQNRDAAVFTARELIAPLRGAVPGARIRLVGRRPDRIADLRDVEGIDVVGPVESVAEELARAHAVLVPIRFGGGTRLKVVEAMAYGVPIVTTSPGLEGIDAVDDEHALVADTPAAVVVAVQRLLSEPGLRARLAVAGRDLYKRNYRPEATSGIVGGLLQQVLGTAL